MINRFFDIKNCPVSTMTTKFFENSKINFTIQQINQLNYNFLSMDLSTSAHAMTSLLSFWKHGADTMSALLSSPSSNHLPLSRDEVESIHNDETTFVNTVRTSTEVLRASSQTPRGQGLRDSVPLPPQTSFCSTFSSATMPLFSSNFSITAKTTNKQCWICIQDTHTILLASNNKNEEALLPPFFFFFSYPLSHIEILKNEEGKCWTRTVGLPGTLYETKLYIWLNNHCHHHTTRISN